MDLEPAELVAARSNSSIQHDSYLIMASDGRALAYALAVAGQRLRPGQIDAAVHPNTNRDCCAHPELRPFCDNGWGQRRARVWLRSFDGLHCITTSIGDIPSPGSQQ